MEKAIVYLKGGFGNQLFQLSFANYLRSNGVNVKINLEFFRNLGDNTPRELILPLSFFDFKSQNYFSKKIFDVNIFLANSSLINKLQLDSIFENFRFTKDDEGLSKISSKTGYFDGYWKSMKYIDFSSEFIFDSISKNENINKGLNGSSELAMVHVRRGDFVDNGWDLDINYYEKSLNGLDKKIKFDIFTDDPKWVKSKKIFKNAENIYSKNNQLDNEKIDTILTFSEMLKYKHFIVGNSSFAFWAAYLKSDINSYVTVPDPWFKNHNHPVLRKTNWHTIKN